MTLSFEKLGLPADNGGDPFNVGSLKRRGLAARPTPTTALRKNELAPSPCFSDERNFYREARYLVGLATIRELERDGVLGMGRLGARIVTAYKGVTG